MAKPEMTITIETKIESSGHPGEYEQPVINIRDSLIRLGWTPPCESDDEWIKESASRHDEWLKKSDDKWIEELENNFKYKNHDKGDLIQYRDCGQEERVYYKNSKSHIWIHGEMAINQLESLVKHMKKYRR